MEYLYLLAGVLLHLNLKSLGQQNLRSWEQEEKKKTWGGESVGLIESRIIPISIPLITGPVDPSCGRNYTIYWTLIQCMCHLLENLSQSSRLGTLSVSYHSLGHLQDDGEQDKISGRGPTVAPLWLWNEFLGWKQCYMEQHGSEESILSVYRW